MVRQFLLIRLLLIRMPALLTAQQPALPFNFAKAGSLAATLGYNADIASLTRQLTAPFPDQVVKMRAIFRWIAENISYDLSITISTFTAARRPKPIRVRG